MLNFAFKCIFGIYLKSGCTFFIEIQIPKFNSELRTILNQSQFRCCIKIDTHSDLEHKSKYLILIPRLGAKASSLHSSFYCEFPVVPSPASSFSFPFSSFQPIMHRWRLPIVLPFAVHISSNNLC